MSDGAIIPIPWTAVTVRPGTPADIPFIDELQKRHTKQVGFMPTKAIEGKVRLGQVIVAETMGEEGSGFGVQVGNCAERPTPEPRTLTPVGYLIGQDQYFKRDDVGIVYQINVVPEYRRSLVAATLLKAQFDRSAYGCKLYCCWCAQDIEANRFWESMGFVPLAFRTGSRTKGKNGTPRVHIFWQRRIRKGDVTTPWWFPSKTAGGSLNEDRIVLPIPPGTHWGDAKPIVLPGREEGSGFGVQGAVVERARIEDGGRRVIAFATLDPQSPAKPKRARRATESRTLNPPLPPSKMIDVGGLRFATVAAAEPVATGKPKREPKARRENDPHLVAAARELRDRWLEEVNAGRFLPRADAKYDLGRAIAGGTVDASGVGPPARLGLVA